jgi:hypothetical protein
MKFLSPSNLRMLAIFIDFLATLIIMIHVLFIHSKFQIDTATGEHIVVLNDREDIERVFLIIAISMAFITFIILVIAEVKDNNLSNNRLEKLEHHLNIRLQKIDDTYVKN